MESGGEMIQANEARGDAGHLLLLAVQLAVWFGASRVRLAVVALVVGGWMVFSTKQIGVTLR